MEEELTELKKRVDKLESLLRISLQRIERLEAWKANAIANEPNKISLHGRGESSPIGKKIGEINITEYPWLSNDEK